MDQNSWLLGFLPVLILIMIHQTTTTSAQYYSCSNSTMFNNGSTYQSNLNTLLRDLASNATNNPQGFYRTTVGNPSIEAVYGEYLCYGDVNNSICHQCVVDSATMDIPTNCPNMKVVILWYGYCQVRYSNTSFFNSMDEFPSRTLWNYDNIEGDGKRYMEAVTNMINVIAVRAADAGSFKKFATDYVNNLPLQTIYGLGQCTPNLNSGDCYACLIGSTRIIKKRKPGGRILSPSCIVRYESYPFLNISYQPQAPSSSLAPGSKSIPVPSDSNGNNKRPKIIVTVIAISGTTILVAIVYLLCKRNARQAKRNKTSLDFLEGNNPSFDKFEELPLFKFEKLSAATNNFQESNKLGQGGFGPVYKGTLEDGHEVAIKRLSRTSGQGVEEFVNEVLVISKLQHRNLVKLLGCCAERFERMLIYDYMPNKSLDLFLFDPQKKGILDWKKRYSIIEGICRGLLYLHRDSRIKIIHRDLKAANILLDENLTPKISDFGMARIFGGTQIEADTTRVVGTYGYMPPEYAIEGRFSEKSDVFSFGVLLLEIITGKKTRWFDESSLSLLGYVWKEWNEGNVISLIDPIIAYKGFEGEISKCIHVGLLCVQEYVQDRPDIYDVITKLCASTNATFTKPKQPGFTRFMRDTSISTQSYRTSSTNDLSITNTVADWFKDFKNSRISFETALMSLLYASW